MRTGIRKGIRCGVLARSLELSGRWHDKAGSLSATRKAKQNSPAGACFGTPFLFCFEVWSHRWKFSAQFEKIPTCNSVGKN
jgi:hypothetical protein